MLLGRSFVHIQPYNGSEIYIYQPQKSMKTEKYVEKIPLLVEMIPSPLRFHEYMLTCCSFSSQKLGIPTANIPAEGLSEFPDIQSGVYYGVTALNPTQFDSGDSSTNEANKSEPTIFPCVLSIGYNPFYKNTVRSVVRLSNLSLPRPKQNILFSLRYQ